MALLARIKKENLTKPPKLCPCLSRAARCHPEPRVGQRSAVLGNTQQRSGRGERGRYWGQVFVPWKHSHPGQKSGSSLAPRFEEGSGCKQKSDTPALSQTRTHRRGLSACCRVAVAPRAEEFGFSRRRQQRVGGNS